MLLELLMHAVAALVGIRVGLWIGDRVQPPWFLVLAVAYCMGIYVALELAARIHARMLRHEMMLCGCQRR